MTTASVKLPTILTGNDEFDRWLLTETHVEPGEDVSPVACMLAAILNETPADPERTLGALKMVVDILEMAFDAGRVTGQMDIVGADFGREARLILAH